MWIQCLSIHWTVTNSYFFSDKKNVTFMGVCYILLVQIEEKTSEEQHCYTLLSFEPCTEQLDFSASIPYLLHGDWQTVTEALRSNC